MKKIVIKTCEECPLFDDYLVYCNEAEKPLPDEDHIKFIPDWCPLEENEK